MPVHTEATIEDIYRVPGKTENCASCPQLEL
jgi:hypothetical protein